MQGVTFNAGKVRVYSLEHCPHCSELKAELEAQGIEYDEVPMDEPQWLAEMRYAGYFANEAPVVQIGEMEFIDFYEAMDRLNRKV